MVLGDAQICTAVTPFERFRRLGHFRDLFSSVRSWSALGLPPNHSFEPTRLMRRGSLRSVAAVGRAAQLRIR
jgi:hypothetical protein